MKLKHRGVILLQLFTSRRVVRSDFGPDGKSERSPSSSNFRSANLRETSSSKSTATTHHPHPYIGNLKHKSRAPWIKPWDSFWRQDLSADAKARPLQLFFSVENAASGSHSQNLLPQDVHWQTAGSLCSAACLEILVYQIKKYHFSSNFQQCYYQVLNSKSQMEAQPFK